MIDTNVNSLLEEFFVHLDPTWDVGYIWAMSHGETVKLRLWIHDQKKREVTWLQEKPTNGPFVNFSLKKNPTISQSGHIYTFHVNLTKLISLNHEQNIMNQPKTHQKPHWTSHIPTSNMLPMSSTPKHPSTHIDMFPAFLSIGLTINPSCEFHATVVQRMWMGFAWHPF